MGTSQDTQIKPHKYLEVNKVVRIDGIGIGRIIGPNQYTYRTGDNLPDCEIYTPVEVAHSGDCVVVPKTDLIEVDTRREIAILKQQLTVVNGSDSQKTLEDTILFLERFVSQ